METMNNLADKNYWWLPLIVIGTILLIGSLIGYFNGWKKAMYFFGFNLTFLIVGVFVIDHLYDTTIKDSVKPLISDALEKMVAKDKAGQIAEDSLNLFKSAILLISIYVLLLVVNFIALIIYMIMCVFGGSLKKDIRENKEAGVSNATSRMGGMMIGTLSAIPFAVTLGAVSTALSNGSTANKFTNGFAKLITFGKADHVSEDFDAIYAIAASVDAADGLKNLGDIFNGSDPSGGTGAGAKTPAEIKEEISKSVPALNTALENDTAVGLITNVLDGVISKNAGTGPAPTPAAVENAIGTNYAGTLKGLSVKAQDNLVDMLQKALTLTGSTGREDYKSIVDKLVGNTP